VYVLDFAGAPVRIKLRTPMSLKSRCKFLSSWTNARTSADHRVRYEGVDPTAPFATGSLPSSATELS
jgi:hypothetical protein